MQLTLENARKNAFEINCELKNLSVNDSFLSAKSETILGSEPFERYVKKKISNLDLKLKERLTSEYFGFGPLDQLMNDDEITEIAVNSFDSVWIEKSGQITLAPDTFLSQLTYEHFLKRLYLEIGLEPNISHPFVDGNWLGSRVHIVGNYLNLQSPVRLTIRKHKKVKWTIEALQTQNWCNEIESSFIKEIICAKKNFIVIGPTGSGKTSVLSAMLNECKSSERIVVIEDNKEIGEITAASTHLLTRYDSRNILPDISLSDLVRQTLRMRPDRLIVGEVRGGEAKDLLMALATGHEGSAGTLHASNAAQALIRLEMLIQMGAPNWSLTAIRKLLTLSIDYLIVCEREPSGFRRLNGIYKLVGMEEGGLIIENAITTMTRKSY